VLDLEAAQQPPHQTRRGVTTTYTYDAANELSVEQAGAARTTYTYDANGNSQAINAAGDRTTYTWDIENHPTLAQLPGGGRNTMTYDGDGKRRRTENSEGLRNILWDGENLLAETDSAGSTVARYTLSPELYGALLSQRRGGATSFHHFDALGSTRALTNAAQTVTDTRDYRAFGLTNTSSGSTVNRFWWNGEWGYYWQPDPQDYWVRARVYNPSNGRWISRDPLVPPRWGFYAHGLVISIRRRLRLGEIDPQLVRFARQDPFITSAVRMYRYGDGRPLDNVDPAGLSTWRYMEVGRHLLPHAAYGTFLRRAWYDCDFFCEQHYNPASWAFADCSDACDHVVHGGGTHKGKKYTIKIKCTKKRLRWLCWEFKCESNSMP